MFDYINIDKKKKIPLYEQIKNSIIAAIDNGILKEGDKLPTEHELCDTFHVSRIVAKQAYTELLTTGKIERKRSKGTFVRKVDNRGICMYNLLSFGEEMKMLKKEYSTQLISSSIVDTKDVNDKEYFKDSKQCLVVKRLRFADNEIFNVTMNIISIDQFNGIDQYDFAEESLYKILEKDYSTIPHKAHRCISAQNADKELAHYLEVGLNAPLIVLKSVVYDENNQLIEVSYEYMSGNSHRFEYDVSL
ncbi:MAG: GntR family transcriptional regulator [Bacillota bacterium]|nr:GntR family transcriptional regulator [Bacillota bacterium]